MEILYKAYTKTVLNKKYYFVKKIYQFPEFDNVDDIVEGYGMHENFYKACNIAGIASPGIRKMLLAEAEPVLQPGKLISIYRPARQQNGFMQSVLRWAFGYNKAVG